MQDNAFMINSLFQLKPATFTPKYNTKYVNLLIAINAMKWKFFESLFAGDTYKLAYVKNI